MKTENDIRKFMKSEAPVPGNGGTFMSDLRRQIDLLPVPAAMSARTPSVDTGLVRKMARTAKRRTVLAAVPLFLILTASCLALAYVWADVPEAAALVMKYKYVVFGIIAAVSLASSLYAVRAIGK